MSDKTKHFTLIIAPSNPNKIKQFRIPIRKIYAILFSFVIFLAVLSIGVFHYWLTMEKLADYHNILASQNNLQDENFNFKEQTRHLAEKVSNMEMMAKSISRLTGIDFNNPHSRTGGIGGFSVENWTRDDLNAKNLEFLQQLNEHADEIEQQVIHLKDMVFTQNLLISSLPTDWPVRGYIGSSFGYRRDPISGKRAFHKGVDISAPYGAKVVAPADGIVFFAGAQRGYGYVVKIAHKYGISSCYGHLSSFNFKTGQRVKKNDVIGFIGSTGRVTGPHLHYEIRLDNKPINPIRFLGSRENI
jgi:murein DD-endopeptidase MepM/ murein hydrolase activator NlpD